MVWNFSSSNLAGLRKGVSEVLEEMLNDDTYRTSPTAFQTECYMWVCYVYACLVDGVEISDGMGTMLMVPEQLLLTRAPLKFMAKMLSFD